MKRFDEDFNAEGRKNIQKSVYNDFFTDNVKTWTVSDPLHSFHNIRSTIKFFQENYESLKFSDTLDKTFMADSIPFLFIINNDLIPINNRNQTLKDFKKIVPDIESQQLISTYANQNFLRQSYLQLISEHPEIHEYEIKNSRNIYKIDFLNDGSIKLVATNLSDLNINNDNSIQKYKSFGIRATVVLPPNDLPIMKYSYFMK